MKGKIKAGFLVLNIILVLCTLLAYASPVVHPQTSRIPATMGLFFPVLFFLNLFTILFWLSFGKWYALISLLCLGLGYPRIRNFIQPGIHGKAEAESTVRLAAYNIFGFHKGEHKRESAEQVVLQVIKDLGNPDLLCLLESVNLGQTDHVIGNYRHLYQVPNSGTLLMSRHQIINKGPVEFEGRTSLSGWADVLIHGDTVRVYILHLSSNKITEASEQLMEEGKLQEKTTWIAAWDLVRKYGAASINRARQADVIREHIDTSPYPVIVMGDFNDTPQSYSYSTIRGEQFKDSFVSRGGGIGTTYAGRLPGLRIDYILMDDAFSIASHDVLKLPYSDHYPVVVNCTIP